MSFEMFRFALVAPPAPVGKPPILQEIDRWNEIGMGSEWSHPTNQILNE
jgi:hypothetical protein